MLPFLQQVAQDLLKRFGDDLKDVAVVLTNKRPIVFLQKHLADLAGKPLWSPSFFTIQEFLRQSSAFPEASPLTQFFVLHEQHNALLRDEGRPEETPDMFYPLAETILSDFAQLDYDLVSPDVVYAELRDIALLEQQFPHLSPEQQQFMRQFWESFSMGRQTAIQQKFLQLWGRLPKLYRQFKDALAAQGLSTTAGIYRDLAEGRAPRPDFIDRYRQVAFVGFNALSRCEIRLFTTWQEDGKALFYFDADRYYLDDELQEAGLFLRRNIHQYGLKNALGEFPTTLGDKRARIEILCASGTVAQAKVLAGLLAGKDTEQSNAQPEDTAAPAPDTLPEMPPRDPDTTDGGAPGAATDDTEPVLPEPKGQLASWTDQAATGRGSTDKESRSRPYTARQGQAAPLASIPRTAIILADESLLIPVLQSLPEGIDFNITMGYPLTQSTLYGLIDLWLTIQQQLETNRGQGVHRTDVQAVLTHPLAGIPSSEREAILEKIAANEWLEVPAEALRLEQASFPMFFVRQTGTAALLGALHSLLDGVMEHQRRTGSLRQIGAALTIAVKQQLNLLDEGLSQHADLPVYFLCALIRKALQRVSAPIEGEPLKGVQIMGLLESRNLDFDEVYVLGVNEGTLPATSVAPSFIPDSIRRAHGLPVLENQDALSAYLFYRLLQYPTRITLVYNGVVNDSNSGEVSRFVRQLAFESSLTLVQRTQQQPVRAVTPPRPLEIRKTGAVWTKLARYLDDSLPNRPTLSASAFTTYLESPLLFFLKYIAGIKEPPRETEEFEMNRLGTVVHLAMEQVYSSLKRENEWIPADRMLAKLPELPDICLRALSQDMYQDPLRLQTPNSMQRILLKVAVEYASVFLQYDAVHAAPLRIIELENKADYVWPIPITVAGETRTVRLFGIIDRVDESGGTIRIVDYKTGRDELKYQDTETLFAPLSRKGNKAMIQTLFYTYVYEQVTGRRGVEPNLYSARKLRSEGSHFYRKERGRVPAISDELTQLKTGFAGFLKDTLEELFNPEIPFRHNPDADLYPGHAYREFTMQSSEIHDSDA